MMMTAHVPLVVRVKHLVENYPSTRAVDDISLKILPVHAVTKRADIECYIHSTNVLCILY